MKNTSLKVNNAFEIDTWDVRSLYAAGKLHDVVEEMQRTKLNILSIMDTR